MNFRKIHIWQIIVVTFFRIIIGFNVCDRACLHTGCLDQNFDYSPKSECSLETTWNFSRPLCIFLGYNYFSNMVCNFLMERITKFIFKCSVEFFVMEYMNTIEYFVFVGGAAYYTEYMGLLDFMTNWIAS